MKHPALTCAAMRLIAANDLVATGVALAHGWYLPAFIAAVFAAATGYVGDRAFERIEPT